MIDLHNPNVIIIIITVMMLLYQRITDRIGWKAAFLFDFPASTKTGYLWQYPFIILSLLY